jgi:Tol biopolymer transport system component
LDRAGTPRGAIGDDELDYADFRLSPDETRLAGSIVDPTLGGIDIWMADLVRGGASRFTFGPAINAAPVWSPDGARVAFRTNRKGLVELYQKSAEGAGNDEPLLLEEAERAAGVTSSTFFLSDWSSDGRNIIFSADLPSDLWVLQLGNPNKPVRILRAPADQLHANLSPDGRLLAYSSNESGRFGVYVQTFPQVDWRRLISTTGGYEPRWRGDGRELYYLSEDRKLMAVSVAPGPTPAFGIPTPLFQTQVHEGVHALRTHYVPSRDGNRFLIQTRSSDPVPTPITLALNWAAALRN